MRFLHQLAVNGIFLGERKVYWSTSKIASHIRSGHCEGASEEEVQRFKQEFVYESPKNLVHRSAISKKLQDSYEVKNIKISRQSKRTHSDFKHPGNNKKPKQDSTEECQELYEVEDGNVYEQIGEIEESEQDQSVSIMILPHDCEDPIDTAKPFRTSNASKPELTQEDKFIQAVYPQFKGKTKLQLIEDIVELKRLNELLQEKAKNYEKTINRLLS